MIFVIQGNLHLTNLYIMKSYLTNYLYGTEPPYNEPQSKEILVTTNTILKRERKIYIYMWPKEN